MDRALRAAIAAIACSTTIGLPAEKAATGQDPGQSSTRNHVVIGCIGRVEQSSAPARGSAATSTTFTITDLRGTPPSKYRLDGDAEQLRLHVGHTVEITGPITSSSNGRDGSNVPSGAMAGASMPTLKVESLIYISTTCST